ncbi:MAG: hypothetical protein IJW63_06385 [Lachnospiraceae bacterium]|nr:hypothetical protein [Lachnospiraceae bacterium]
MASIQDRSEKARIENEKKQLKADKARQKKEAKRRARDIARQEAALEEEGDSGGFFTFFATVGIVIVWLAIICVVIKLDVGGFGSGVLTPLLKDVPVVSWVLPTPKTPTLDSTDNNPEGYTLTEALERINQLELQLEQAQGGNLSKDEEIAELKAEVVRLKEFEDKQLEFQRITTSFYEEVIYAEKGPGAEEYRKYYEEIDPTTAEYLYKQVVKQLEESQEILDYAAAYSSMKPKQAAGIFEQMTDKLDLVARILGVMNADERGEILGAMDPEVAAKLTKIMDPES